MANSSPRTFAGAVAVTLRGRLGNWIEDLSLGIKKIDVTDTPEVITFYEQLFDGVNTLGLNEAQMWSVMDAKNRLRVVDGRMTLKPGKKTTPPGFKVDVAYQGYDETPVLQMETASRQVAVPLEPLRKLVSTEGARRYGLKHKGLDVVMPRMHGWG